MTIPEILGLFVIAGGGWFLWDSMRVRERANTAIRAACKADGLLLLDDTVALESVWPVRDGEGQLKLRRVYGFDYTDTGAHRRRGVVTLVGTTIAQVRVDLPSTLES